MNRQEFHNLYNNVLRCYSEPHQKLFPAVDMISENIFRDLESIDIVHILESYVNGDNYLKSILNRMLGVRLILISRESQNKLDIISAWRYIANSIKLIPVENTISSIGSQGFLSIPLYKIEQPLEQFDFIRLHIWDDSLNDYMDLQKCRDFGIHSHTFHANSWIITGKIVNQTFDHTEVKDSEFSLFKVEYNKSINQVNQHSSSAVNQEVDYKVIQLSDELHFSGSQYNVRAGRLHRSGHKNSPGASATFFSFTGKNGLDKSIVIGPKEIKESPINRNIYIDPIYLLDKIEKQLQE